MADIALVSRLHRSLVLTSTDNERPGERALQDSVSFIHVRWLRAFIHIERENDQTRSALTTTRAFDQPTTDERTNGRTDDDGVDDDGVDDDARARARRTREGRARRDDARGERGAKEDEDEDDDARGDGTRVESEHRRVHRGE